MRPKTALSYMDNYDRTRLQIVVADCDQCGAKRGEPCRGWKDGKAWLTCTHVARRSNVREFKKRHREKYINLAKQLVGQHFGGFEEEETRC